MACDLAKKALQLLKRCKVGRSEITDDPIMDLVMDPVPETLLVPPKPDNMISEQCQKHFSLST